MFDTAFAGKPLTETVRCLCRPEFGTNEAITGKDSRDVPSVVVAARPLAEHSRETFAGVLDLCEELATRYFAPHNKTSDAHEPTFDGAQVTIIPDVKQALGALARADLISMSADHELGGSQLPAVVAGAGLAWFHAANIATTGYVLLSIANANLLATYGSPDQIDRFVKPPACSAPKCGSPAANTT